MSDEKPEGATVTAIAPMSQCSSCGATVRHDDRFKLEAHNEGCMQPEVRFRRAERAIGQLQAIVEQLAAQGNDTIGNQVDLHKRLKALEER